MQTWVFGFRYFLWCRTLEQNNCLMHALKMTDFITDDAEFGTATRTNDSTGTTIYWDVFSIYSNLWTILTVEFGNKNGV